jgi:hypothetical protein
VKGCAWGEKSESGVPVVQLGDPQRYSLVKFRISRISALSPFKSGLTPCQEAGWSGRKLISIVSLAHSEKEVEPTLPLRSLRPLREAKFVVKLARMKLIKIVSGAHNLLQIRTKVLNNQLRETFVRWYPGMQNEQELEIQRKAA